MDTRFELIYRYFEHAICSICVQSLFKTAFGFYQFLVKTRTWLGRFGDVCGVISLTNYSARNTKLDWSIPGQIWPYMDWDTKSLQVTFLFSYCILHSLWICCFSFIVGNCNFVRELWGWKRKSPDTDWVSGLFKSFK